MHNGNEHQSRRATTGRKRGADHAGERQDSRRCGGSTVKGTGRKGHRYAFPLQVHAALSTAPKGAFFYVYILGAKSLPHR